MKERQETVGLIVDSLLTLAKLGRDSIAGYPFTKLNQVAGYSRDRIITTRQTTRLGVESILLEAGVAICSRYYFRSIRLAGDLTPGSV